MQIRRPTTSDRLRDDLDRAAGWLRLRPKYACWQIAGTRPTPPIQPGPAPGQQATIRWKGRSVGVPPESNVCTPTRPPLSRTAMCPTPADELSVVPSVAEYAHPLTD